MRRLVLRARDRGYCCAVFNYRGFRRTLKTAMVTTSIDVSDFASVIRHLRLRFPRAPLLAAGFSMGANMLTKLLGQAGHEYTTHNALSYFPSHDKSPSTTATTSFLDYAQTNTPFSAAAHLTAAVSVSNAFDYVRLSHNLSNRLQSVLYSRPLTHWIKARLIRHPGNMERFMREKPHINMTRVLDAQTIWEMDDRFTRQVYGLPNTEEYYRVSSSLPHVGHVRTPLLCLNSLDDPFLGGDQLPLPRSQARANPHLLLAVTKNGGHCSWETGYVPSPSSSWLLRAVLDYCDAVVALQSGSSPPSPPLGP